MNQTRNRALSILLLLAALLLPVALNAAKPDAKAAVQLAEKTYDFGTVKQTDPSVVHVFKVQNTGNAPLVIISATASCGCTRPTFTDHPVAPGETAEVKVTFVPRGQLGDINKEVKVRTNAPDAKRFSLRITGKVTK